jgi:sarcosine oxidase delta subunit
MRLNTLVAPVKLHSSWCNARQLSKYTLQGHAATVCAAVQVDIEPQELQDMIAEFDRDQDGAINEEEFKAIVTAMDD